MKRGKQIVEGYIQYPIYINSKTCKTPLTKNGGILFGFIQRAYTMWRNVCYA